jgi:DNA topoisomerase-1
MAVSAAPSRSAVPTADPVVAARAVGLRYTLDTGPGIRRRRAGTGWSYRGPDGARIDDAPVLQRIRSRLNPRPQD